ncbi:outer membrane protein assembly factor BamD [Psychrobacter aestuarii]|uniref:Outer membrane protein assembly factor BamD n=1 Tax=Psychrobacter aestuarii TaxID=556327 RepID=A0ABN0VXM1_9GAMM|nr:outer membrane protein assembly factor BamD [Psychrobacter aestuarii]
MRPAGNTFIKLSSITLLALSVNLVGCQTFKNLTGKNEDAIATAEKSEQSYYRDAVTSLDKNHYNAAIENLTNLRTFYPTGQYAEQALLDTMYAQYESDKFEDAAASADQFIRLYPANPQVSYAYYVRGVANMEGSSDGLQLFKLNQAERDTAYLRIAFANFQELVSKYPNSPYTPDAAQRMTFIYNQFAESEISAAKWYIEREAYVAAANRAKWVFQYYPQSDSVPEAIAILAYSHEQLGLTDLANDYRTLLRINYPEWLTSDGEVKISTKRARSWLNKVTFGKLGRSGVNTDSNMRGEYTGATRTQMIRNAAQLRLPSNSAAAQSSTSLQGGNGVNVGLGLPESATEQITSQASASEAANDASVDPQFTNPTRRTTTDASNSRIRFAPSDDMMDND